MVISMDFYQIAPQDSEVINLLSKVKTITK